MDPSSGSTKSPRLALTVQILIIVAAVLAIAGFGVYEITYIQFNAAFLEDLQHRSEDVNIHAQVALSPQSFLTINDRGDETTEQYLTEQAELNQIRDLVNAQYLYTAKRNSEGWLVYVVDGLDPTDPDFRHPGDFIEPEMIDKLSRCLQGEPVVDSEITNTDWGYVFVSYWPVKNTNGDVVGAVGMEFNLDRFTSSKQHAMRISIAISALLLAVSMLILIFVLKKVSEPYYKKLAYHDYLTGLPNLMAFEHRLRDHNIADWLDVSFVMFDINGLSEVNSKLGHSIGDQIIKQSAKVIADTFKGKGTIYRVAGDEICVMVCGTPPEDIRALLVELTAAETYVYKQRPFNVSYGMATYDPAKDNDLRDTMERADREMYKYKKAWKDSIGQ